MNKGGGAGSGAAAGGGGPTAAAAAAAAQRQKGLLQRVETDIANIVDNFTHLVNVSRVASTLCIYSPTRLGIHFNYQLGIWIWN